MSRSCRRKGSLKESAKAPPEGHLLSSAFVKQEKGVGALEDLAGRKKGERHQEAQLPSLLMGQSCALYEGQSAPHFRSQGGSRNKMDIRAQRR